MLLRNWALGKYIIKDGYSLWKEHFNHITHQEKELTVLEQEWKLKTVEKLLTQDELKVEKN